MKSTQYLTDTIRKHPRRSIQIAFTLLTIWIGIEFYVFVTQLEGGGYPTIGRPPGVEAFLPISALMSLKYWLTTGIFNTIHPSALVLFLIFAGIAVLLKKGFCSWICPFGLLSEYLAKIHIKMFDRQRKLPGWLDYPLRSLKYLLLFFLNAIFMEMGVWDLETFIYSPYNRVADIKMLYFFTDMSRLTFWTLVLLILLSIAIPCFWCRYLCPYGALLGMLSWISPFKIRRTAEHCIDCEKCTKVCPARINVHKAKTVHSDECHACLQCGTACLVKDTLYLSAAKNRLRLRPALFALVVIFLFALGTTTARLAGVWNNSISEEEYLYHIKHLNDGEYHHNRGQVADYDREKWKGNVKSKEAEKGGE
jgi:polyferredoxin